MTMKHMLRTFVAILMMALATQGFTSSSAFVGKSVATSPIVRNGNSNLQMFFGGPKDDGKPGDYVCKVCHHSCLCCT